MYWVVHPGPVKPFPVLHVAFAPNHLFGCNQPHRHAEPLTRHGMGKPPGAHFDQLIGRARNKVNKSGSSKYFSQPARIGQFRLIPLLGQINQ